mmetsp:Transcript_5627/g.7608  ORF Transcript_5627/g.7608 Transcript_5627/m.7608 type:complete len:122 (+) Transcript_5627:98-463(+)
MAIDRTEQREPAEPPLELGRNLRACLRCRLLKSYNQFYDKGCENCPFLSLAQDQERVVECTTTNFSGIFSVMDPQGSWAARWSHLGRFVPGCYALTLYEDPPEEVLNILEDHNIPYQSRNP